MNFLKNKVVLYSILLVSLLIAIVVGTIIYSNTIRNNVRKSTLSLEEMSEVLDKTSDVNSNLGKTVEEVEKNQTETIELELETEPKIEKLEESVKTEKTTEVETVAEESKIEKAEESKTEKKESVEAKELEFVKPVDGDIIREFAKENLVYSETLEEWITHLGIDIKAPKTSVVKAAEAGVIESIKNDPRYGITIIMKHDNGYQTIYANLLTTEFVTEGESVEKGQSIGTVGNTAAFEISDEPHLHFEILKDSQHLDPSLIIK